MLPIAFMLAMLAAFRPGEETFSAPIRTGWIFLHIVLLLAAYAALVVSLLASLLYLIQERRLKSKAGQPSLASAAGYAAGDDRPDRPARRCSLGCPA